VEIIDLSSGRVPSTHEKLMHGAEEKKQQVFVMCIRQKKENFYLLRIHDVCMWLTWSNIIRNIHMDMIWLWFINGFAYPSDYTSIPT